MPSATPSLKSLGVDGSLPVCDRAVGRGDHDVREGATDIDAHAGAATASMGQGTRHDA